MKFKSIALSLLLIFSASIPSHTKAFNPVAILQLAVGAAGSYYSASALYIIYSYQQNKFNPDKEGNIRFIIGPRELLALAAGGSVAAATCLIAGYQAL